MSENKQPQLEKLGENQYQFENMYGYRAIFLAMVVVILICIPLYHVLHGRKEHTLRNAAK